jgi:hypothetical protein
MTPTTSRAAVMRARRRPRDVGDFFHALEKFPPEFPFHGKIHEQISMRWKKFRENFHAMENFLPEFPCYGKKLRENFHAMEKIFAANSILWKS